MKKRFLFTAAAVVMMLAASAQSQPPKPPKPPAPAEAPTEAAPPPPPPAAPPPPPPVPELSQASQAFDAFMKRNPSIRNVQWQNDEIVFKLKSGKEERYNLADEASRKEAVAKYGELPSAPPPPPPPPPPPAPSAPKSRTTLS